MDNNQQMFIQVWLINWTIIYQELFINSKVIIQFYHNHLLELYNQIQFSNNQWCLVMLIIMAQYLDFH